jgi:hypothetical protein
LFAQGNALEFDGIDDHIKINVPLLPTLTADDPWSFEAWVKTSSTGYDVIYAQYDQFNPNRMVISVNHFGLGKVNYWKFSTGEIVSSTSSISDDNWHHIAVVKEGSGTNEVHLYFDGILEDSGTDPSPVINVPSEIGRITNTGDKRYFPGSMDEIRTWNFALSAAQIADIYNDELTNPAFSINCLSAYYQFNQTTGNKLIDTSGNGNNGTLINMDNNDWVTSMAGVISSNSLNCFNGNNELDFDGVNDYLVLDSPLLPFSSADDAWTIETWFKTTTNEHDVIFAQYNQYINDRMVISVNNTTQNKVTFWKFSGGEVVVSSTDINDGNWHHVAVVKEGSGTNQTHLYLDGILEDSGTDPTPMINVPVEIGRITNTDDKRYFPGQLDEMRIWHKALTATEIANIYKDEFTDPMNSSSCLIANYQMNQESGHFLPDMTGNENTARLINMTNDDWVTSTAPLTAQSALSCTGSPTSITINDVSKAEGNWWGVTLFNFQVTRSGTTEACSVDFSTSDGTALVMDNDYTPVNGTVNWSSGGSDVKTIWLAVRRDNKSESDENFFVNLSNPVNCSISDAEGEGTIINDDGSFAFENQENGLDGEVINKPSELKIFPNPAQNKVTITGLLMNDEIQIFDCLGREIYRGMVFNNQLEIDISDWEKGFYFIEQNTENQRNRLKFLKI